MRKPYIFMISGMLIACTTTSPTSESQSSSETAAVSAQETLPKTLEAAVVSTPFRDASNITRDGYRHPLETLKFFGIKPDMTVIEIWPGRGWYTEILAPYLSSQGNYVAAIVPAEKGEYAKKNYEALTAWEKNHPSAKMQMISFAPPTSVILGGPNTADMVLTFRNVHNWLANDYADQAFAAFFVALKPGGILGIVEHRQNEKAATDPKAKSGYVKTSEVIRMATHAGFKLDAQSELNANPKDTKDYPEGVWTLPPTLKLKDQDQAKYMAIGESDRMTLRFIKPKK